MDKNMNNANNNYIYVILKGEYSDRHICAVTTDKERAIQLEKLYGTPIEKAFIETFIDGSTIAENLIDKQYKAYIIRIDTDTNSIISIIDDTPSIYNNEEDGYYSFFDYFREGIMPFKTRFNTGVQVSLYARDEEHAKKIAYDKCAQYKAELLQISM